jgi:hypothetical protein
VSSEFIDQIFKKNNANIEKIMRILINSSLQKKPFEVIDLTQDNDEPSPTKKTKIRLHEASKREISKQQVPSLKHICLQFIGNNWTTLCPQIEQMEHKDLKLEIMEAARLH